MLSYSCFFLIFHIFHQIVWSSKTGNDINIGLASSLLNGMRANTEGVQSVAAILMAINEINNKSDGIFDGLLPNSTLRIGFRSPQRNYVIAIQVATQLTESAFDGQGVSAIIGTGSSDTTDAIASVLKHLDRKVAQVSYGGTSSSLGHGVLYPYFSRLCPSDAYEGRILARFIKTFFGWSTVYLIYSGDTYGNDISLEFRSETETLGIDIERMTSFRSGTKDFTQTIRTIMGTKGISKVFVLLIKSIDAGPLLEQGYNIGLFKQGTQILGTQYLASTSTYTYMSLNASVADIMKGAIAVTPSLAPMRTRPIAKSFISRFLAQRSTMRIDPKTRRTTCSSAKDDEGYTYLYQDYVVRGSTKVLTCAGLDFKAMAPDGSQIVNNAFYAYDATYALAYALHHLIYSDNATSITGDSLVAALIDNVLFDGVTGRISFSRGYVGADAYSRGDRETSIPYQVLNFSPDKLRRAYKRFWSGGWSIAGTWTEEDVFEPCNNATTKNCTDWLFNTIDNKPVVDGIPNVDVQMNSVNKMVLFVLAIISLILILQFHVVIELCRQTRLVIVSQPRILRIVLWSCYMACIRVIITSLDVTTSTCIAGVWLGHISFALGVTALILKVSCTIDIYHNDIFQFHKIKLSERGMNLVLIISFFFFCVYLAFITILSRPHVFYETMLKSDRKLHLMKCVYEQPVLSILLYTAEGVMLLFGAALCWNSENTAKWTTSESRYIRVALYMLLYICAVVFPIVYFKIDPTPATKLMVTSVGLIIATLGCLMTLFTQKTYLLWRGVDVGNNFELVRPADEKNLNTIPMSPSHVLQVNVIKKNNLQSMLSISSLSQDTPVHTNIEQKPQFSPSFFRPDVFDIKHTNVENEGCCGLRDISEYLDENHDPWR